MRRHVGLTQHAQRSRPSCWGKHAMLAGGLHVRRLSASPGASHKRSAADAPPWRHLYGGQQQQERKAAAAGSIEAQMSVCCAMVPGHHSGVVLNKIQLPGTRNRDICSDAGIPAFLAVQRSKGPSRRARRPAERSVDSSYQGITGANSSRRLGEPGWCCWCARQPALAGPAECD